MTARLMGELAIWVQHGKRAQTESVESWWNTVFAGSRNNNGGLRAVPHPPSVIVRRLFSTSHANDRAVMEALLPRFRHGGVESRNGTALRHYNPDARMGPRSM